MIITFVDTETTGLNTMTSEIIQFAYIQMDTNGGVVRANCFNLWEDSYARNWSEDAAKVHGFSMDYLKSLPKEEMQRKYEEMFVVMSRANLGSYNGINFDYPLIQSFMRRHSVEPEPLNNHFDVMNIARDAYGKRRKLVDLTAFYNITPEYVQRLTSIFFNREGTAAHDAAYDTTATMLNFMKLRGAGHVQV